MVELQEGVMAFATERGGHKHDAAIKCTDGALAR